MMTKRILSLTITIIISAISTSAVFAADVPRESAPCYATEESIKVAERYISDVLDEVQTGLGFADAKNKCNARIFKAIVANQTNGFGYAILTEIANNAIFHYRNMYERPEFYKQTEEELKILLADLINDVRNGKDYATARDEAYTRIYQTVDASYNPDVDRVGDFCYWDIPPVDGEKLTVARKLLLEAEKQR